MTYIPHERLTIDWAEQNDSFVLSLPWVSMEIDVTPEDKEWIKDATSLLHSDPCNRNVQKFIQDLKDYPVFYIKPRSLEEFAGKDLQICTDLNVDSSTPHKLIETFGCPIDDSLKEDIPLNWNWDREKILDKARIKGTDLYDPISFVTYLICYRLEWESTTWSGQDGFGKFLEKLLKRDEEKFFHMIGWISKQSWYVTKESGRSMEPALIHFSKASELIEHFMADEAGHYKFMEQVFSDIGLDKDNFPVADGTKWLLASHKRVAEICPLAFSAMVNLFEAAYYEGQDPISRVIKLSSKPDAARGYDLHYKINQEHRHCDMPVHFAACLAPQSRKHALLTLALFEFTLHILDEMENKLAKSFAEA
ncbi:MAG: hypothetical protein K2Y18_01050 [Alphaproteobacteria bacterium]|jgi:hypothetical protein|nr:hypothetical protein [Alphaproteobacteria bacterium]